LQIDASFKEFALKAILQMEVSFFVFRRLVATTTSFSFGISATVALLIRRRQFLV
jgi:hypothetical protein